MRRAREYYEPQISGISLNYCDYERAFSNVAGEVKADEWNSGTVVSYR